MQWRVPVPSSVTYIVVGLAKNTAKGVKFPLVALAESVGKPGTTVIVADAALAFDRFHTLACGVHRRSGSRGLHAWYDTPAHRNWAVVLASSGSAFLRLPDPRRGIQAS
jgi:hypothetical protein